ncbi:MAG: S24 family peptidase [Rikenellaceae bacterium]
MIKKINKLVKIRKYLGLTQSQLADILMVKQNTISLIENDKISLIDRNKQILIEKLGVNPLWLDSGEGDIFIGRSQSAPPSNLDAQQLKIVEHGERGLSSEIYPLAKDQTSSESSPRGVPYYAKPVTGSMVESFDDMSRQSPEYYIDIEPLNNCAFYRPIYGESMTPRYNPGDIVACQRIHNKKVIMYGEAYLCMIQSGADYYETVKILRRNPNPAMITLRPVNPNFDETTISINDILQLYIIRGKIERNF